MKVNIIKNLTTEEIIDLKTLLVGGFKEHDYSGKFLLDLLLNKNEYSYFEALTTDESDFVKNDTGREIIIHSIEKEKIVKVLYHNLKVFEDYEETEIFFNKNNNEVKKTIEKIKKEPGKPILKVAPDYDIILCYDSAMADLKNLEKYTGIKPSRYLNMLYDLVVECYTPRLDWDNPGMQDWNMPGDYYTTLELVKDRFTKQLKNEYSEYFEIIKPLNLDILDLFKDYTEKYIEKRINEVEFNNHYWDIRRNLSDELYNSKLWNKQNWFDLFINTFYLFEDYLDPAIASEVGYGKRDINEEEFRKGFIKEYNKYIKNK